MTTITAPVPTEAQPIGTPPAVDDDRARAHAWLTRQLRWEEDLDRLRARAGYTIISVSAPAPQAHPGTPPAVRGTW